MKSLDEAARRRDQRPRPQGGRPGRTLLIAGVAIVLVVAIALGVSTLTGTDDPPVSDDDSPGLSVAPAPDYIQPSEEDWEALLPRLQKVVDAAPGDANALRKLALAYHNLDRLDEAASIYERLLAIEEDAVLRDRLANVLRDQGDLAGAEAAYRKAIADDPSLAPAYLNLAELLWRQGRDKEALAVISEGLEVAPEEGRASFEDARAVLEGAAD